jgi:predicted rRNA methylase YqxC with S4 and FtsJ domains
MKKIRLDAFLAEKGLSQSREKGRREIVAGWVKVNGEPGWG